MIRAELAAACERVAALYDEAADLLDAGQRGAAQERVEEAEKIIAAYHLDLLAPTAPPTFLPDALGASAGVNTAETA